MNGIDVSKYQGNIDFKKVKKSGIDAVIIRAGYGKGTLDNKFLRNIQNAVKEGFNIGVYWFMYAKNETEAKQNALSCIKYIEDYKDYINLKVWADWEYDSDANYKAAKGKELTKAERTNFIKIFCDTLKAAGYQAGYYANLDYMKNKIGKLNYPLWYARYGKSGKLEYVYEILQTSSDGTVPGIKGKVDLDTITIEDSTATPTTFYIVNTVASNLHVRSGPGIKYPAIGAFKKGTRVSFNSGSGSWLFVTGVTVNNKLVSGYCSAQYLRKE